MTESYKSYKERIVNIFKLVNQCSDRCDKLYEDISPKLQNDGYIVIRHEDSGVMSARKPDALICINASYQIDINERAESNGVWVIQTSLHKERTHEKIYDKELGYENTRQFTTYNEIINEVNRVHELIDSRNAIKPVTESITEWVMFKKMNIFNH
jgi:hypothetical protein